MNNFFLIKKIAVLFLKVFLKLVKNYYPVASSLQGNIKATKTAPVRVRGGQKVHRGTGKGEGIEGWILPSNTEQVFPEMILL